MHPILASIDSVQAALTQAADANPVYLSAGEKKTALMELVRAESRLVELRLRVEASAGDVAEEEGARDIGAVLVAAALDDPKHAHADVKLAQALERYEDVRAGLACGDLTCAHARVIVQALDALPDEVPHEVVTLAQKQLCAWAAEFTPAQVRKLGLHILTVVAPEIDEEADAKAIARLEADGARRSTLSVTPLGDGTSRIHGIVPEAVGSRLVTVLEAYSQPRIAALEADGKVKPRGRLFAEALAELLETLDPAKVPAHGGDATTVVVTIGLDQLRRETGIGELGDGTPITAGQVRRLACTAGVIPMVLGGRSEILDLGRTRRLFSPAQRKALRFRDKHCLAEGCTVPATWCESHHFVPWSQGGTTDIKHGGLLCSHHHHRAHDPAYDMTRLPTTGEIRFHRRR